jgi:hypothetical protein
MTNAPDPCRHCATPEECHPDCPHRPRNGDEATVQALCRINIARIGWSWLGDHEARAILAAIRSGAIPLPEDTPQLVALRHDPKADARPVIEEWRAKAHNAWAKADAMQDEITDLRAKLAEAVSLLRPLIGEYGFCMHAETPVHHENCRAFLARIAAETEAK